MTDNAINDKYTVPLLNKVNYRLNNHVSRVVLIRDGGNATITDNSVLLHEITNDNVYTDYNINTGWRGIIFECILPEFTNESNELYLGGNYHGATLSASNQIQFWNWDIPSDVYSYTPGDLYRQYYDSINVYFSINGEVITSLPITNNYDYVWIGLDGSNETDNTYLIERIAFYETGKLAYNGYDGDSGVTILSGGLPPLPTLGNYNDIYIDVTTNVYYQNFDGWQRINNLDPTGSIVTLSANGTRKLWDFVNNNYSNILIHLVFAVDASVRTPVNVVQLAVNMPPNRLGPHWRTQGTLPSNVYIDTVNNGTTEQSVRLHSNAAPAYNYIGVKIQIIS